VFAHTTCGASIFGYGEFNYNRFRDFNCEVEIEHAIASAEDRGEVEMEQAYLD